MEKKQLEPGGLKLLIPCALLALSLNYDRHVLICSGQGKPLKNAGWDFSIGGSQSTGTVRSVVRPPPVRERRPEVSNNQATQRRTPESGHQGLSASGNAHHASPEVSFGRDAREQYHNEHPDNYHEDVIISLSFHLSNSAYFVLWGIWLYYEWKNEIWLFVLNTGECYMCLKHKP